MNLTKTTALAAALIALAGCQKGAENTAADEATVREAAPAFEKAMNEGDKEEEKLRQQLRHDANDADFSDTARKREAGENDRKA